MNLFRFMMTGAPGQPATNPDPGGGSTFEPLALTGLDVQYFGDSVVAGTGADDWTHGWIFRVRDTTSGSAGNAGTPGMVMQGGSTKSLNAVFNPSTFLVYTPGSVDLTVVAYGTNDVVQNNGDFTPEGYGTYLATAIDTLLTTKGHPADRVVVMPPYHSTQAGRDSYVGTNSITAGASLSRLQAYVAKAQEVAAAKGVRFYNVYQYMLNNGGDSLMHPDGIHPNEQGHIKIAEGFIAELTNPS